MPGRAVRRHDNERNRTMSENQIVVYQPNETMRLDVRLENETVWLTQEQIANLFGTKRPAITKHLANIYKSGELERDGTCSILEHMGNDGRQSYRTMFYNLDAILSVGYRVNSRYATLFRRWATQVLKSYLLKGYALNTRLNQLEDKMDRRFARHDQDIVELKDRVDLAHRQLGGCGDAGAVVQEVQVRDSRDRDILPRLQVVGQRYRQIRRAARRVDCSQKQELPRPLPRH